jgi:tetratricopeptide (TPR) repeat protein
MKRRAKNYQRRSSDAGDACNRLSARRQWLFRVVAIGLPFLFLGLFEMGLRLLGYGYDPNFFRLQRHADGKNYLINNDEFTFRFFPPELSRCPTPFKMDVAKRPGVRRVMIFGESAAMGDPQPSVGPGHILDVLLREKFPGEEFEVINLGITAINSHVILPIAKEVAARGQGDIWLLYIGNNEMVGPFGAATAFGNKAAPLSIVKLNLAVQRTRAGQLAVSLMRRFASTPTGPGWGGMEMFLENRIAAHDVRRETIYRSFDQNLTDIVKLGVGSGAKVILSTVSVNLRDCPPFGSLPGRDLSAAQQQQFDEIYAAGVAQMQTNQPAAAMKHFASAAEIDPDFAELQFRWAQALLVATNYSAAREHFQRACDKDALPFRADTRINQTIRAISKRCSGDQLLLCDVETAMALAANDGIAGEESFFEHVHFNFDGNYRLAKIWAEHVLRSLPKDVQLKARDGWASQEFCESAIGLAGLNRMAVIAVVGGRIQKPPLADQFTNPQRAQRLQKQWNEMAQTMNSNAISSARMDFVAAVTRSPEDNLVRENFGVFLKSIRDKPAALAQFQKITEALPHDFYSGLHVGRLLGELGRWEESEAQLRRCKEQRPFLPDAWYELGVVHATSSNYLAALEQFDHVLRLQPKDFSSRLYKARMLRMLQRQAEAIQEYRSLIQSEPARWEGHLELAELFAANNQAAEAIPEYQAAVALNPRHPGIRLNLGVMLARQNLLAAATEQFQAVLALSPTNTAAANYLREITSWRKPKSQ